MKFIGSAKVPFLKINFYWSISIHTYMHTNTLSRSTFYRIHRAAEIYKAVYTWAVLFLPITSCCFHSPGHRGSQESKREEAPCGGACHRDTLPRGPNSRLKVTASPFPSPACSWVPLPQKRRSYAVLLPQSERKTPARAAARPFTCTYQIRIAM